MAKPRTPKQKAALRKAQLASARKRRKPGSRRRTAVKVGAAVAVGGAMAYGANRAYKKDYGKVRSRADQVRKSARKKAANNPRVREAVAKDLLAARRAQGRRGPVKGLKVAPKYRQGRPDVRRRRKAKAGR